MTIASELQALQTNLDNSYTAVSNKGGTLPVSQNFDNLSTAINSIPTAVSPVITSLSITPTTSQQVITAPSGTDGYSPITISAVTASIDNNIVASNIKSGISILGINGSVVELQGETRSVSITSTSGNTFTPLSGKNGITSITVTPTNQAKTITPSTSSQSITVPSGYSGFGTLTVNAVTSAIDNNIVAGNIKSGVSILGITGDYTGLTPALITKNITANGTYNASSDNADGYSSVTVNVSGGSSTKYGLSLDELLGDTNANGVLQAPVGDINLVFTGVQDIANYALRYSFYYNNKVKTVSFPNLTNISGDESMSECFRYNTALVSLSFGNLVTISAFAALRYMCASDSALSVISFPELTTISGRQSLYHAFDSNTALVSISFPKLKYVTGGEAFNGAFESDSNLENVSFDSLEQIGDNSNNTNNKGHFANAFRSTKVKNITFPKLEKIYCNGTTTASNGTFYRNASLEKLYFPKLDTITYGSGSSSTNQNACKIIFSNCTALTEIHFAAANKTAIEATAGYSTKWGATNATIYFDL